MTHTPGPWTLEEGEYTGNNWLIGSLFVGHDSETGNDIFVHITTDHVHASELGYTRALDDGRLIVAAPKLLEACKMALSRISPPNDITIDAYRALCDAIADAEGKP